MYVGVSSSYYKLIKLIKYRDTYIDYSDSDEDKCEDKDRCENKDRCEEKNRIVNVRNSIMSIDK